MKWTHATSLARYTAIVLLRYIRRRHNGWGFSFGAPPDVLESLSRQIPHLLGEVGLTPLAFLLSLWRKKDGIWWDRFPVGSSGNLFRQLEKKRLDTALSMTRLYSECIRQVEIHTIIRRREKYRNTDLRQRRSVVKKRSLEAGGGKLDHHRVLEFVLADNVFQIKWTSSKCCEDAFS